jgi:hypothetical protein
MRVIIDRLDGGNLLRNLRIDAAGGSSGTSCMDQEKDDCGAPAEQQQKLAGGEAFVRVFVAGIHLEASSVPKRASQILISYRPCVLEIIEPAR